MQPFDFLMPSTFAEAAEAWGDSSRDARLLAGGTDLNVALRHGHLHTERVIDLKRVAELRQGIEIDADAIRVPATATMTRLSAFLKSRNLFPALQAAADVVGSIQIRNRATLVGNICNASPAADTVPVLASYGAAVEIRGGVSKRISPVADFIEGNRKIDLARGEIVSAVLIPLPEGPRGCAFDRITRRRGVDLATANLCCTLDADGVAVFSFGAVSPRPLIVEDRSGVLADPAATAEDRAPVLAALADRATPITDVRASAGYRAAMLQVMGERALVRARQRLEEAMLRA